MKRLKTIVWNFDEARLRMGFRVVAQYIMAFGIMIGLFAIISLIVPDIKFEATAPWWVFFAFAVIRLISALGSVGIAGRYLDKRKFNEFGFHFNKKWWIDFVFGLGLGALLVSTIFLFEYGWDWIAIVDTFYFIDTQSNFIFPFAIVVLVFISVGINEEITTRGYLLRNIAEGLNFKKFNPNYGIIFAWIFTSAIFGIMHIGNPNMTWLSITNIALAGILFGLSYVITGELAIPIGIHISWNIFQGNIFGWPVSGLTIPRDVVSFIKIEQTGPELWTGGAFGPEGGLLGSLAIIAGCVITFLWIRFTRGKEAVGLLSSMAIYKKK